MTLLDGALTALVQGLAVFPCVPRDKLPHGKLVTHGVKDATHDEAQVREWWAIQPDCNIGVTGGTIVDCDSGLQNLEEAKNFALLNGLPASLAVRTGRRDAFGVQFHFSGQSVSGLYRANNVSGEVRSGNLYGLWAGSVHPISGEKYEVVIDLPRAECPPDLLMAFRTDGSGSRMGRFGGKNYEAIDLWTARERYSNLLYKAAHALKGQRHQTANNVCYFAARAFLAGVFDEYTICDAIVFPAVSEAEIKWEIYRAVAPLYSEGERDIEKMLRDSWESGVRKGRLALNLYAEDYLVLGELSDDDRFQRCFDGDTSDFPDAVTAKAYMELRLIEVGATDVPRILRATRILDAVANEITVKLKLAPFLTRRET